MLILHPSTFFSAISGGGGEISFGEGDLLTGVKNKYNDGKYVQLSSANDYLSQKFMPDQNIHVENIYTVAVALSSCQYDLRIETDDGGLPSGTLVDANAAISRTHGSPQSQTFTEAFPASFVLEKDTYYHFVFKMTNSSIVQPRMNDGRNPDVSVGFISGIESVRKNGTLQSNRWLTFRLQTEEYTSEATGGEGHGARDYLTTDDKVGTPF